MPVIQSLASLFRFRASAVLALGLLSQQGRAAEEETLPPPPPPPPTSSTADQIDQPSTSFDLIPHIGSLSPLGDYSDDAKSALQYGLSIATKLPSTTSAYTRASLDIARASLGSKGSNRSGTLNVTTILAQVDYVFTSGSIRPFVGIGAGLYKLKGEITETSTGQRNKSDSSSGGLRLATGVDFALSPAISMGPVVAWNSVGGDFNTNLLDVTLALRLSL